MSRFDQSHRLEETEDRNGLVTHYEYDTQNRLTKMTDPVGLVTTLTYDSNRITITDPANRNTILDLDSNGNLVQITDPDQASRLFRYDDRHHMIGETDQRGNSESAFYDQFGRATRAIRKDGTEVQVNPVQTSIEISQGEASFFDFDLIPSPFVPLKTTGVTAPQSQFADANGNVVQTELNGIGFPTQQIDAIGSLGSTSYNENNLPIRIVDALGYEQVFRYDDRGNVIETWDSANSIQTWVGPSSGNWSDPTNWSQGLVPGPEDYVFLDGIAAPLSIRIDVNVDVRALEIGSGSSAVQFDLIRSVLKTRDGSTIAEGSTFTVTGSSVVEGPLLNRGEIKLHGYLSEITTKLTLSDASTFENHGLIQLSNPYTNSDRHVTLEATTGTITNGPEGTIEILNGARGGLRSIVGEVINEGTFRVTDRSFVVSDRWTNTGVIDLQNGSLAVQNAGAQLTNEGVILVPDGSGFTIGSGGTFIPSTGRFDKVTLTGTSVLGAGTNQDEITTFGSQVKIDGAFNNAASGVIKLHGYLPESTTKLTLSDASTFENHGLIQLSNPYTNSDRHVTLEATTGTITNGPEGTIELLIGARGGQRTIAAPLDNAGVLRLVDISSTFTSSLTNSGQLQIGKSLSLTASGGLALADGGVVAIEVDGANGNQSGRLNAGSSPQLAGQLDLIVAETATFSDQSIFSPVTFNTANGGFTQINPTNLADHVSLDAVQLPSAIQVTATVNAPAIPLDPPPVNPFDVYWETAYNPAPRPSVAGQITTTATPGDPTRVPVANRATTAAPSDPTRDPIDEASHTATPSDPTRDPIVVPEIIAGEPSFTLVRPSKRFTYDPVFNQLTSVIDALGHQTIYEIDPANGNMLSMTEVIGLPDSESDENDDLVTNFTYTALGLLDTVTDPLGRVTDFDYNVLGRQAKTTYAVGTAEEALMSYAYDAAGNLSQLTDENGNVTTYAFDDLNRLLQISEPDPDGPQNPLQSPITTFQYDTRGNLVGTTDANGNATSFIYDPLERRIQSSDSAGNIARYIYDSAGNLTDSVDPLGNATTNSYDERGRLIRTTDPEDGVTEFAYDAADNLQTLTDPVGNATTFTYDARYQVIAETDPLGNIIRYEYDLNGNLVGKIDRNDRATEFAYDGVDRLVTETWRSPGQAVANEIVYTYDKVGNLTSKTDHFSGLEFTYDARDRVASVDIGQTPDAPHVVLDYTYDGVGNVTSVADTIEGATGATTSYEYDALNRQIQIAQSGNQVSEKRVDLFYNALGQFASIERYSDLAATLPVVRTFYSYDELNRLTDLRHRNASTDIAFYEYEYDASSRIASINDIDGLTTYSYDDRDQLIGADRPDGDVRGDESYTYDANGNRIESHLHGSGYVTGDANRLISDGTYNYEYDNEGNMVRRTEIASGDYRVFEWDHRNRLVGVSDYTSDGMPSLRVVFSYDGFNRRVVIAANVDISSGLGASSSHFVYDREDVILDFMDPNENPAMDARFDRRYLHGPSIDFVLAQELENQAVEWLLRDHLGSTQEVVLSDGTSSNSIRYSSFGITHDVSNEDMTTRYLFAGREYDAVLGISYYRNRYYDSNSGRFLSEDPARFGSGDPNLFAYVFNAPNSLTDPFGLTPLADLVQLVIDESLDEARQNLGDELFDTVISNGDLYKVLLQRYKTNKELIKEIDKRRKDELKGLCSPEDSDYRKELKRKLLLENNNILRALNELRNPYASSNNS